MSEGLSLKDFFLSFAGGLILVGSVGMFLGGVLIRVFKLEIVGMLRLNVVATLLSAILGIAYLAKCPEINLAGHSVTYPGDRLKNYPPVERQTM